MHKCLVAKAGRRLGVPWLALLKHDLSKFRPLEFIDFSSWVAGDLSGLELGQSHLHHRHRNPHHAAYWCRPGDTGQLLVYEMPEELVREMAADWQAAKKNESGSWDLRPWYLQMREQMIIHPNSRALLEQLLCDQSQLYSPAFRPEQLGPLPIAPPRLEVIFNEPDEPIG